MKQPIYKCHVEWFYLAQVKAAATLLARAFFHQILSHQDKIKNFDWTVIYSNPMRTNIYKDQTDIHSDHVYFISVLFLF